MKYSSFTFILTDDCNYTCSYCYQTRAKGYLEISSAKKAVDFFWPYLENECYINFYGGEPLLAFDTIREIVRFIEKKNIGRKKKVKYGVTTNGSLIDDRVITFFENNKFSVVISFDGFAQEVARQKGSFNFLVSRIEKILEHPGIALETNSVFTPETVGLLSPSMKFIIEHGVQKTSLSFSNLSPWNGSALSKLEEELARLRMFVVSYYRKSGILPVDIFHINQKKDIFGCLGGMDRLALAPDDTLWGCFLIADYLRGKKSSADYNSLCFGTLEAFMKKHKTIYPAILSRHSKLRQEYFFTSKLFCQQCKEIKGCIICPMEAALVTGIIGMVPEWTCKIKKICMRENLAFIKELKRHSATC